MTRLALSTAATTVPPNSSIAEVSIGSQQDLDVSYGSNENRYMSERKRRPDSSTFAAVSGSMGESKKRRKPGWTPAEDEILLQAAAKERAQLQDEDDFEDEDWDIIAQSLPGKSAVQCFKRFSKIGKKLSRSTSVSSSLGTQSQDGEEDMDDEEESNSSPKGNGSKNPSPVSDGAGDWTEDEVNLLKRLIETYKDTAPRWQEVSANFANHSPIECLTKWQALTNPPVIKGKGSWTAEEDAILREKRAFYGRKWAKIAAHLPGRQGKQCRERFVNHLDPELKKGEWTDDEEAILIAMHEQYGNRWANISKNLPGRSDNDVKNHWYSTIQRKFAQHGREVSLALPSIVWIPAVDLVLLMRQSHCLYPQKLTDAALQQVQLMQSMGTMPTQQQQSGPNPQMYTAPPGYPAAGAPPNAASAHQHPPPPFAMYGYPYHQPPPPPPGQGVGSTGGNTAGQTEGGNMPPPPSHPHAPHHAPPPHWHHYPPLPHSHHHPSMPPPPHPYYHQHYGGAARPPTNFMPQGSGHSGSDTKKRDDSPEGSPWKQGEGRNRASSHESV